MTLKTELTTDLDTIFNTDEFAVNATYGGNTINVIFDDAHEGINMQSGIIESTSPQALAKTSDVAGITHGNTLVINSVTYYVVEIHPEGNGLTLLKLSKDTPR